MAKIITPENFNESASLVYGTYEGKGFWQVPVAIFQAEDEDAFGNLLPEEKAAFDVAKEALEFQAQGRRVIIAETEAEVLELMRANVVMN